MNDLSLILSIIASILAIIAAIYTISGNKNNELNQQNSSKRDNKKPLWTKKIGYAFLGSLAATLGIWIASLSFQFLGVEPLWMSDIVFLFGLGLMLIGSIIALISNLFM